MSSRNGCLWNRTCRRYCQRCSSIALHHYLIFFRLWSFPKQYGYELSYHCRRHAQIVASCSRDVFVPLMAAISFMLMLMDWQERQIESFNWYAKVLTKTSIHHQWLADLEMSAVADFTAPKMGGILDFATCDLKWMLPILHKLNMPLYLHWGPIADCPLHVPEFLLDGGFSPGHREINNLQSIAQSTHHVHLMPESPVTTSANNVVSAVVISRTFPLVERGSSQRQGEDWKSFFTHRKARDVLSASQKREQQSQKEKNTAIGRVPGKKGARVYIWEEEYGFLVRRAAGWPNYEMV